MPGLPAGRTSSVKALEKTFILQTEFKIKPKQAVVTAVSLDGQVIHRVERSYTLPIESEEEIKAAEAAITAQHESIARKIMTNGSDFIRQTKSISISRSDRLGVIPGVSYVVDIMEKLNGENPPLIYKQASLILALGDAIAESSRTGKMKMAAVIGDNGKFILDRYEIEAHLISLKNDAEIGQVIAEIENG